MPADFTAAERQFLNFALDLAFNEMVSNDGFTDDDHAALEKLRLAAGEKDNATLAPTEPLCQCGHDAEAHKHLQTYGGIGCLLCPVVYGDSTWRHPFTLADAPVEKDSAEAPTSTPQPEADPVPLRWGLDDVEYGDDDTTTVLLSGPDGAPYVLELDPERTAVLRQALAGPKAEPLKPRQRHLLSVARQNGGWWTTTRVRRLYAVDYPGVTQRGTARRDLELLVTLGHMTVHGPTDGRYYLISQNGGSR